MKKKILSFVLAFVMLFSCVCVSAEETRGETASRYLTGLVGLIEKYYKYGDVTKEELYEAVIDYLIKENPDLLEGALKAATDILDDYTVYYTQNELGDFVQNVHQTYVGIGVTVQKSDLGCIITEVNPSGGAYAAGITAGDELIAADGVSLEGMSLDEIVSKIQGVAGTTVTVEVLRGDAHITLDIERKQINIQTVTYEIIDDIGYIHISSFATPTAQEVKDALYDIEENHKLKKLIIDVRDNPGGELNSVIDILSMFVPENKVLVKFEYKNERMNYGIKSKAEFSKAPNREIVILANENSASASELFCGTMQYYKLATVVGQLTFGKGSMQEMMGVIDPPGFNLGDIKLTMAEFTKPDGGRINHVGVFPDKVVKNKFEDFDEEALTPMTINARYTIGDEHSDVLAIEERLNALGYNVGEVDGVFDKMTHQATKNFQADTNLHPYGVMDYTTQARLNDVIEDYEVEIDTQKATAIEILSK
ncbi:MAG: PDZ domain-containing protein [Clostridia bacterium]|nr:PDZ domain-containing protein [Clostridia bacterium]